MVVIKLEVVNNPFPLGPTSTPEHICQVEHKKGPKICSVEKLDISVLTLFLSSALNLSSPIANSKCLVPKKSILTLVSVSLSIDASVVPASETSG